jgi:Ca-activated chloride channel family protein
MTFRLAMPWLLALIAVAVVVLAARPRRGGAGFAPFPLATALPRSRGPFAWRLLIALGLACVALAAARPQYGRAVVEHEQAGRDLMIVIDTSLSMSVDDIRDENGKRGDRLAAVFNAAKDFIRSRPDDRVGLVFFASTAVISCPLTYDHETAIDFIDRTEQEQRARWNVGAWRGAESGFVGDGTNIGLGLGYALKELTDPLAKGRAIVLITDGADSKELPNWIDPLAASRHAAESRVKIYGIGVGDPKGTFTRQDVFGRVVSVPMPKNLLPDMARLEQIVAISGGTSFPANDKPALQRVLKTIDELELTPHVVRRRDDFADRFALPLALGAALIGAALLLEPRLRGIA